LRVAAELVSTTFESGTCDPAFWRQPKVAAEWVANPTEVAVKTWREQLEEKEAKTGKIPVMLRLSRASERAVLERQQPWIKELSIDGRILKSADGDHDLAGATARVETSGEIERRVTAARLVALGVFAFAAKKKRDKRDLFLTVEGPSVALVRQYKATDVDETALRQFAADINRAAAL
jgi:hypothetical protein